MSITGIACSLTALLSLSGAVQAGHDGADVLAPLPADRFTQADARHLLLRAGFGGSIEEVQRLHRLGLDGMVSWLVDYEGRPDVVGGLVLEPGERIDRNKLRRMEEAERRRVRQRMRRADALLFQHVRRWWMDRMLTTRRPLEEKMTLFWHGHFTTSYRDVRRSHLMLQQNELLRFHATGNFGELLHQISTDPAMLRYLNNNQNRKGRPNENFAREVMELFSLGVGNYDETDIKQAARAFTGWTLKNGQFTFNRRQHDTGRKTIFGKSGNFGGHDVCDMLLQHAACAPHVAGKIFAWFAYDDVEPELREELGRVLASHRYELKPLLRRIFKSEAFYSKKAKGSKIKSPVELLVSTVRMLGMNPPPAELLLFGAQRLGQTVMSPPNVKGWEGGLAWITTANLLERDNLCGLMLRAGQLVARGNQPDAMREGSARRKGGQQRGNSRRRVSEAQLARWDSGLSACAMAQVTGASDATSLVDALCGRLLVVGLRAKTRAQLVAFVTGADGSRRLDLKKLRGRAAEAKLRKLLHLIMSTPEYQVC